MNRRELESSLVELKQMLQKGILSQGAYDESVQKIYDKIRVLLQTDLEEFRYPQDLPTRMTKEYIKKIDDWLSIQRRLQGRVEALLERAQKVSIQK